MEQKIVVNDQRLQQAQRLLRTEKNQTSLRLKLFLGLLLHGQNVRRTKSFRNTRLKIFLTIQEERHAHPTTHDPPRAALRAPFLHHNCLSGTTRSPRPRVKMKNLENDCREMLFYNFYCTRRQQPDEYRGHQQLVNRQR